MANTSFLPEDYIEKKTQRRTNIISVSLFVVVMAGIIGAFLVTDGQGSERRELQLRVNAEFEEAAKRLEQLEDLQQRKDEMIRKARVTAMLIERIPRSLLLAELINQMPSTLSFLELKLETKTIRRRKRVLTAIEKAKQKQNKNTPATNQPQVQPTESSITLIGVAPTDVQVAQFMTSLSRSDMFTDVNLAYSEEANLVDDHLMRKFKIDLKINPDVEITKIEPNLVQRQLSKNPMNNTIQIDGSGQLVIPVQPLPDRGVIPAVDRYTRPGAGD